MSITYEDLVLLNIMRNCKGEERLLPLQFVLYDKLEYNDFAFVFDEVGCGKTVEAGICIWNIIKNGGRNVLIIAPANLSFNWYAEMLSKFGLDFKIIGGTKESIDIYFENCGPECRDISHLCIISYDSRNSESSNAAIDRIGKIHIEWDLIVLDEGHESKNANSCRHGVLKDCYKSSSARVLFLSATPIKNLQEDFSNEFDLVKTIIKRNDLELELDPIESISFSTQYPVSRNFKEFLLECDGFKKRNVYEISYRITDKIVRHVWSCDGLEFDQKRNCIMLFEHKLRNVYHDVFTAYRKPKYEKEDVKIIREFDTKLDALIVKLLDIADKGERIVIFCNHIEVINYLKKVLQVEFGSENIEAIHGETYGQEERKRIIRMLDEDDSEMNQQIVILSHKIASVGVNLSKFNHLINYELPYTPADLEQRFGRIDRLTNDSEELNMYYFTDDNNLFDTIYLNRIWNKLNFEVLPLLPSKNLLKTVTDSHVAWFENIFEIEKYLENIKIEHIDDELNSKIYDIFKKDIATKSERGEIQLLDDNIGVILERIDYLKKYCGFDDLMDLDPTHRKTKIENYLKEQSNKIFYMTSDSNESKTFGELTKYVYTEEYNEYAGKLRQRSEKIKDDSAEIAKMYDDGGVKGLVKKVRDENIGKDDSLIFMVLYGVWCSLKWNGRKIDFWKLMTEYNERNFEEEKNNG